MSIANLGQAKKLAKQTLSKHSLTVPVDLDDLAKKLDVTISIGSLDAMSGFAYQKDGKRVIGVNKDEGELRQRFTIAHEFGHMLLHGDRNILYDKKADFTFFRDDNSSTGLHSHEMEANAFAAELLMPRDKLIEDIQQIGGIDPESQSGSDMIIGLANTYKVSTAAMSIRIASLTHQAL